ncbi:MULTISPECIES: TonB-dependent receptor [unclassified Pseudomonas]|uniref:TonB-dependent receptor plug domain-containing protein n=1 Tax=unclassified Pseudomonas TaxID=196821 RepID=UPI00244B8260|nr:MULTISPECIES: TonB-dependent receptor [unclassified Pseudomonas]MDG9922972.1 TonB-dependent receptor [Pseudomonas sp. GD04045]MDH0035664.1 TonB-dependent receptor [Pseudomonas sp. GD04019]
MNERSTRRLRRSGLAVAVALAMQPVAWGQEQTFSLGSILVVGQAQEVGEIGSAQVASVVSQEEMRRYNRNNVGDALALLSGVTLSNNSRNEKTIHVRGFDSRQIPLFIDGIPVYVPYDGYIDFNRFTTADLSAIQVAKGFSSVAYGPNALGGAINLISRKPTRELEGDVSVGMGSESERRTSVNVGSNQGSWYLQGGASYLENEGFPLPSDFHPTPSERGGQRNNAYREDGKLSFKLGLTPREGDEYALSYYSQKGEKGQPPSTDPSVARYWQWPYWDKESLYFVSQTALGDLESLKLRLYHDRYDNEVRSYTDDAYDRLKTAGRGSLGTGRSIYHDRTSGGSVELESRRMAAQTLRLVGHYKSDEHEEVDGAGTTNARFQDDLSSLALEDNIQLGSRWLLSLGASRHRLEPESVFSRGNPYALPDSQTASDAQAGLFFDLSTNAQLYATVARKTRLPTLKDRYSQRLGSYVENPDLQPERALNYELGYRGTAWRQLEIEAALFYSDISDKIQSVANVVGTAAQMQNVGKVRSQGLELGLASPVSRWLELGGNYTLTDLDNRSDSRKLTDVPRHKLIVHASFYPAERWELVAFAEHDSSRWASDQVSLDGFTTLNFKAAYSLQEAMTLETGLNNLTDEDYSLADGFPSAGRTWFVNADYRF